MNMDFFFNRKTIRKYKSEAIPSDTIERMLDAAAQSPTTGGMQLYSVVITDKSIKEELAKSHFNQPAATGAPMLLTFCADFNRFIKWCELSNAKPGFDNFQSFVAAFLDAAIFAQQFCTIAEMNGLGCCYLGTTTYNAPQIAKTLNLPKKTTRLSLKYFLILSSSKDSSSANSLEYSSRIQECLSVRTVLSNSRSEAWQLCCVKKCFISKPIFVSLHISGNGL